MPYDKVAQRLIAIAMAQAAEVMDYPADLINVAIEELVKERYELPAFSTLDRLARHIRSLTNTHLFQRLSAVMSTAEQAYLDGLLLPESAESEVTFNLLKASSKSATFSHIQELQVKFNRLMLFGDAKRLLVNIAPTKVQTFAAQARGLDISELRDIKPSRRHTLLVCLLYQAQVKTRDHLVEMFLKRMQTLHNRAKERLVELREQNKRENGSFAESFGTNSRSFQRKNRCCGTRSS